MSAFGATAEDVTAFDGGGIAATTISIGPDAVTWADLAPSARAGVRIAPPVDAATLVGLTPRLAAGARIAIPPKSMTWAEQRTVFSLSAFVSIPPGSLTWANRTPALRSGASMRAPADTTIETDTLVNVRAGKRLSIPANPWIDADLAARPAAGKREDLPTDALTVGNGTLRVGAGNLIGIDNTVTGEYTIDATGEDATAEHGALVGEPTLLTRREPDHAQWTDMLPRISAGASGMIPVDASIETDKRLEIGARRRKLRAWSIAS